MTRPALQILDPNSPASYTPSALDCIGAIVASGGDLDLAGERVFGPRNPRAPGPDPKAQLIATIADDSSAYEELQKQLRVLTLLQTFQRAQSIGHVVEGTIDKQELPVLAKLYTQMLAVITELTDDHTQNINSQSTSVNFQLGERVLRALPAEIREAVKVFQQTQTSPPDLPPTSSVAITTDPEDDFSSVTERLSSGWSGGDPPPNAAIPDTD